MGSVDLVSDGFEGSADSLVKAMDRFSQDITSNTHRLELCVDQFRVSVDKLVTAMGMQAENEHCKVLGESPVYDYGKFASL